MSQEAIKNNVLQGVSGKSIAKYALLPGIIPRLRSLSRTISSFLFMFVQLFGAVGLIDRNHPCLRPENIGRYSFSEIVGLAASKVVFDKKHLPQTIMFFAIVGSIVISIGTALVGLALIVVNIPAAHAQLFGTPPTGDYQPTQDWAFLFLSEVFGSTGLDNIWGGTAEQVVPGMSVSNETRHVIFHTMLRSMFATYSQALLVIAAFMVIYLIITMVADAARTGQPFGSNFNSVWAPIRLALGVGLLLPISGPNGSPGGYNGAQLIAFQVAEWGSNLATNVWNKALDDASSRGALVSAMQPDDGYRFMRGIFLISVCIHSVNQQGLSTLVDSAKAKVIKLNDGNENFDVYAGAVVNGIGYVLNPDYCGSFKIPKVKSPKTIDLDRFNAGTVQIGVTGQEVSRRYRQIAETILGTLPDKGQDVNGTLTASNVGLIIAKERICNEDKSIEQLVETSAPLKGMHAFMLDQWRNEATGLGYACTTPPGATTPMCNYLNGAVLSGFIDTDTQNMYTVMKQGKRYGWSSAGSVMLLISAVNSAVASAMSQSPAIISMPRPLTNPVASPTRPNASVDDPSIWDKLCFWCKSNKEKIAEVNKVLEESNNWFKAYPQYPNSGLLSPVPNVQSIDMEQWMNEMSDKGSSEQYNGGGEVNPMKGAFNFIGRMFMVDQTATNPIADVMAIGSNLFITAGVIIGIGLILNFWISGMMSLAMSIATPLAIFGYMLAVVVPTALFMNFLFAVMEWVISVFEAVLGMPLWALSFISIGGDGIGDKAMSGVMMLFEIMLRPTVIVICTVGSMLIFAGSLHFFNSAFALYYKSFMSTAGTVAGIYMRIGSLFMYVLTVYSIGNSAFKIIPTIANGFMRWIGGPGGFSGTMQADIDKVAGVAAFGALLNVSNKAADLGQSIVDKRAAKKEKQADQAAADRKQYETDRDTVRAVNRSGAPKDSNYYAAAVRARDYRLTQSKSAKHSSDRKKDPT